MHSHSKLEDLSSLQPPGIWGVLIRLYDWAIPNTKWFKYGFGIEVGSTDSSVIAIYSPNSL
jgi:hypothetical protein